MAENKFLNKKTALAAGGLVAAYLIYKQLTSAKDGEGMPQGSLGGEDDLTGQQGFDIDPNSPINDNGINSNHFIVQPDGSISSSPTPTGQNPDGTVGVPSTTPTYSSGQGSLVTDAAVLGGALGFNALLPNLGKGIKNAIDAKYAYKPAGEVASESNFQKWIKDPYNVGESAASKVMSKGESEALKVSERAEKPIVREAGQEVLQTMPKWAKGVKGVANFVPFLDIPIGASLDVYFSKYEEDPNKKIGWVDAFEANTAGELAQLGFTGAGAAAGTVVPVAGNIAGGVTGFVIGTGADIAATEAVYKAKGKSSLFDFGSSSAPIQVQMTPAQQSAQSNLYSAIGVNQATPFTSSSNSSSKSSSSSNKTSNQNMSVAPKSSSSSQSKAPTQAQAQANLYSAIGTTNPAQLQSSAKTSNAQQQSKPATAPATKPSVISKVVTNVQNLFKSKKKK